MTDTPVALSGEQCPACGSANRGRGMRPANPSSGDDWPVECETCGARYRASLAKDEIRVRRVEWKHPEEAQVGRRLTAAERAECRRAFVWDR